jgi:hypothetical protein
LAIFAPRAQADETALAAAVKRLEAIVAAQEARLDAQEAEIARLKGDDLILLDSQRGTGPNPDAPVSVGEAPEPRPQPADVAALPDFASVLTPPGRWVLEGSTEFGVSSNDRLVFRGVEIVPGLQIGVIEASDAERETAGATIALRTGLTRRLEFEARVPYLWRSDRITTLQQRDETVTRTQELAGDGLGDIEASLRYQFTRAAPERPVLIGNLRVKSDTGSGPFDIGRDEFGVATSLATGSGFWGVEPGLTLLYPTDPAVLFANVGYMINLERDVDQVVGEGGSNEVRVGRVDPGDSISASLGYGFSINPRLSYSLGYRHTYLTETETELNDTLQRSDDLHVGSLLLGLSLRTGPTSALSASFEFGVTEEAPDARVVVRAPFSVSR